MAIQSISTPTWSKSQVAALKECRRKYFLNIKSSDKSHDDPLLLAAAKLKKTKNRFLWGGGALHEAMGDILKSVRQGVAVAGEEAIAKAREKMRNEFQVSRNGEHETDRLFEHAYNIVLSAEAWQRPWKTVETGLRWFLQSKWLARLSVLGPECWKAVDEILEFKVGETKAYVKIDCAVETGGRFYLIDWKTSPPSKTSEAGLQVAALYAHEVWGADPEQIEAIAVSVMDGKSFHANIDEDSLMQSYLQIEEETALLEEARVSMEDDIFKIAPAAQLDICRGCSYQKICHPQGI